MIDLPPGVRLVLASGSPRRSELLRSIGLDFDARPADLDESIRPGERPLDYVLRLSAEKAAAVATPDAIVVGADTTVEVDGQVLGKPLDDDDARRMLALLAGRVHQVHTGVTVISAAVLPQPSERTSERTTVSTAVEFAALDAAAIDAYVATGEPMDKAGGYAIQGAGGALVLRVDGSVSNVIGLPLAETLDLLRSAVARPT